MEQLQPMSDADRAAMLKADKANTKLPEPPYEVRTDGAREPSDWLAEWQAQHTVIASAPTDQAET